jgi:hypothetical protein
MAQAGASGRCSVLTLDPSDLCTLPCPGLAWPGLQYMAEVYKTMVDMGLGMSGAGNACSRPGACSSHPGAAPSLNLMQPAVSTAPPQMVEAPGSAASAPAGGVPGLPARPAVQQRAVMGEEEQLAFFQSLQRGGQ